jgi:uncharacterized membrane protein
VVVADLIPAGPDPSLGEEAKQRSLHNNYLTLPVVLTMISGHYPMLFAQPYLWQFAAAIIVGAGLVRHYYNLKDAGRSGNWIDWLLVYAAGIAISLVIVSMDLANRNTALKRRGCTGQSGDGYPEPLRRSHRRRRRRQLLAPRRRLARREETERYADQILRWR